MRNRARQTAGERGCRFGEVKGTGFSEMEGPRGAMRLITSCITAVTIIGKGQDRLCANFTQSQEALYYECQETVRNSPKAIVQGAICKAIFPAAKRTTMPHTGRIDFELAEVKNGILRTNPSTD